MAKNTKKITLGLILSWVFGIVFGLSGLTFLFSASIIVGGALILASLILLPPINKFVKEKWNFELSKGLKITLVIILFFIYAVNLQSSDLVKDTVTVESTEKVTQPQTTPSTKQKVKSATINVDRVVESAANLGKIRITVTNTGDVSIKPKFDVSVKSNSGSVICEDSPMLGIGSVPSGEKTTDEIQLLACIFEKDGDYTVNVDLLDKEFNKLDTASKTLTVNYWDKFDLG